MRTLRIQGMAISFTYTIEDGKHFEGPIGIQSIQVSQIPLSISQEMVGVVKAKIEALYKEEFQLALGTKGKS